MDTVIGTFNMGGTSYRRLQLLLFAAAILLSAARADAQTYKTLYSFEGGTDGTAPIAALTYHSGAFYGTTYYGGASSAGTIFKIDVTTNAETIVYSFAGGESGEYPEASLTYDGAFFGTTAGSGDEHLDDTVFQFNPDTGVEKRLFLFKHAANGTVPLSSVIYLNGDLYGTTSHGGTHLHGTIYKIDAKTHAETVLYSFNDGDDGAYPIGGLIAVGNRLYGTTAYGGAGDDGCVFEYDVSKRAEKVLHTFLGGTDGANPIAGLLYHDGSVFGTTSNGGTSDVGTVFSLNLSTKQESVVHTFNTNAGGSSPGASLILVKNLLYGTAESGGEEANGTVFSIDLATGAETVLHTFTNLGGDGSTPEAALIFYLGALYGTTADGGTSGRGTVFRVKP